MKALKFDTMFKRLKQYRPLLNELVLRDLKIKYRRSFLGYIWSLLNPLLMMAVMSLVFSYMFRFDIPNYPLYLICGQTLWTFLCESTNMAMNSIISTGSLIRKVYIPKYIFPLSRVVSSFVTMMFSLVAIMIVVIVTRVPLTWKVLLVPIPLILLLVFSMGIGMALAALAVYFRDMLHLYSVLTTIWMYVTPIFYPISILPQEAAVYFQLNPMYHYITFFREVVVYGNVPDASIWIGCIAFGLLSYLLGFLVFRKLQRNFILYV